MLGRITASRPAPITGGRCEMCSEPIADDILPEPYSAAPNLVAKLRIEETTGEAVHALALRAQVRIDAHRRPYSEAQQAAPACRTRWTAGWCRRTGSAARGWNRAACPRSQLHGGPGRAPGSPTSSTAVLAGGVPHHSFAVFCVYPWVGLLGDDRRAKQALAVLDRCRIRSGRELSLHGDQVVVESVPSPGTGTDWATASRSCGPSCAPSTESAWSAPSASATG